MPFLLHSLSAESYGMGESGISLPANDPFFSAWNPSLLGIQSLEQFGGLGITTTTPPAVTGMNDAEFSARGFSAGVRLSRYYQLPFELSLGIAYSHISNDFGAFASATDDPNTLTEFKATESAGIFSVSVGADLAYLKGAFGFSYKNIESNLAPYDVYGIGKSGVSTAGATDIGLSVVVPVMNAINSLNNDEVLLWNSIQPYLNVGFGFATNNVGEEVVYIDPNYSDPLPRTRRAGMGLEVGLTYPLDGQDWKFLNLRWSLDASDLMINRWGNTLVYDSAGQFYYEDGKAGWEYREKGSDINYFQDVILGFANDNIEKRKGWEIGLFELFYLRGGKIEDPSGKRYTKTTGYGFRLGGIMNFIKFMQRDSGFSPAIEWIVNHVDFVYSHASGTSQLPVNTERAYNGFSFFIKN